jgi:hypothetical protein
VKNAHGIGTDSYGVMNLHAPLAIVIVKSQLTNPLNQQIDLQVVTAHQKIVQQHVFIHGIPAQVSGKYQQIAKMEQIVTVKNQVHKLQQIQQIIKDTRHVTLMVIQIHVTKLDLIKIVSANVTGILRHQS